jgi:hypothetical protein
MAKQYLSNVLSCGDSVYRVFKYDVEFRSVRNRRECLALSKILDAALRGDLRQLVELTVRRLAGVHTADTADNNWDACDAIEQVMEKQSFMPTRMLQSTLRSVTQLQALQQQRPAPARPPAGSEGRNPGSGRGSGGRKKSAQKQTSHQGDKPAAGVTGGSNSKQSGGSTKK